MSRDKKGRFAKKGIAPLFIVGAVVGAYFYGTMNSKLIYAKGDTVEKTIEVAIEAKAPILDRIAKCESKTGQFRADGTVVTNTNTNGTVDVGKYQINMSAEHIREMAKLGFNPLTEEGNTAYAKWLYANRGTGPWASSAHCWSK